MRALAVGVALAATTALTTAVTVAPSSAGTTAVEVSISKDRVISMPSELQPGVNTFKVTSASKRGSSFQLARPAEGYTADDAARDIKQGLNRGKVKALKRFEANVALLGGVSADATADTLVVDLDPGDYWAVDTRSSGADKFFPFTVAGEETGEAMPAASTIRAKKATTWAKAPRSIPRAGMMKLKNDSSANHFILLTKLKKGKTYRDFKKWFKKEGDPSAGPPPVKFNVGLESGVVSPGYSAVFDYKLPRGTYVMLCFWPDASMGGMPHAYMGMHRAITLK